MQPDWLFGFLKDPVADPAVAEGPDADVRPLGRGGQRSLVDYFTAMARKDIPFVYVDTGAIPPEHIEAAKQLMSPDYFNCFSCHVAGQQEARRPAGGLGARSRDGARSASIRSGSSSGSTIRRSSMPGTKMPSFYPGGPEDVLGGDEERQIRAMRDYLMVLGRPDGGQTPANGAARERRRGH